MKKLMTLAASLLLALGAMAQDVVKLGIIGLDTSHAVAFTKLINSGAEEWAQGFKIVAAYPQGSQIIKSSYERIPKYIEEVKQYDVEIVESIAELLEKVDCVFLETNDGTIHLEQAAEVFKAGKRCFIDKPVAATLGQAIAIYELAEKYGVPTFSTSTLRFTLKNQELRNGVYGPVLEADCYSPHKAEPTHPDYGFYGIHGVETLFTVMGPGCVSVSRVSTPKSHVCVGTWENGRVGTFRAIVDGPQIYGGTAYTWKNKAVPVGGYVGYKDMLKEILKFFQTGEVPVSKEETLEIFTFMRAANMSEAKGGKIVTMEEAWKSGQEEAKKLLKQYDKTK